MIEVRPAEHAASVVFVATRPMPTKAIADSVLPGLNPLPAEPENRSPADGDGEIRRQHGLAAISLDPATEPRPQNDGAGQRDKSTDGMDHGRSREIMEAHAQGWEEIPSTPHVRQPAVRSPRPVSDDWINETSHADTVEKVADEPGAADHRARSNA